MDSAHNFGQIRLHVSRALFHLNHLASLIPFCVIDEDASDSPPVGVGRHLVRWSEMTPPTLPASSSSRTLITHGQLPSSMVLNPEPHFRPISVRRHLEADSSTPGAASPPPGYHIHPVLQRRVATILFLWQQKRVFRTEKHAFCHASSTKSNPQQRILVESR